MLFRSNELTSDNRLLKLVDQPLPGTHGALRPFAVPIAATSFHYAPAEYPMQKGEVVLRAIAEQTGQDSTSWELRFLCEEHSL